MEELASAPVTGSLEELALGLEAASPQEAGGRCEASTCRPVYLQLMEAAEAEAGEW